MSWWLRIIQGLMIPFRPELIISLWASQGVSYYESILIIICWTSLSLLATYFGTGAFVVWLKRWRFLGNVIEKLQKAVSSNNGFLNNNYSFNKVMNVWLSSRKNWVILFCIFFPYTYLIPGFNSCVIATSRFSKLKYMVFILLLGNTLRWSVITYHFYQAFS